MKIAVLLILCCCLFPICAAGYHIIGGEIYYKTLGLNRDNTRYRYLITLKLYRDADFTCGDRQGCIDRFENPVTANIYMVSGARPISTVYLTMRDTKPMRDTLKNPCLAPKSQHLEVALYSDTIELPAINGGYFIASQRCCRGEKITNIYDSEHEGSTYYTIIPGSESKPYNNSAYFDKDTSIIICNALPFTLDYAAYDEDGDSLTYSLCNALTDGTNNQSDNSSVTPPPYNQTVRYIPPYAGANPVGGNPRMSISNKGLISCTPDKPGKYVITVCVNEYDRATGAFLGTHSKDILLTIFDCQTKITAKFPPVIMNCAESPAFDIPISNSSIAGFTSAYLWTFGDGTDTVTNSQTLFYHQYPDTGVYKIKLVVNPGLACTDSLEGVVHNYPGLKVGFTTEGLCKGEQIRFNDTSSYLYGHIVSKQWDFGNSDPVSIFRGEGGVSHVYNAGNTYPVSLTIKTDNICERTVTKDLKIYEVKPFAGNDTILAKGQQLVLPGSGGDFYSWTPTEGLSNPSVAQPLVTGNKDITYYLKVSDRQGCFGYDSINIKYYTGPEIYVPTAFSPNGDGQNDRFRFIPVGITTYKFFRIFNRWGVEIYSSPDYKTGWDGTYKGDPAPVDTYIWILQGVDFNGKEIMKRGTVTLIR